MQYGSFNRNGSSVWKKRLKQMQEEKFSFTTALQELRYCKLITKRKLLWILKKNQICDLKVLKIDDYQPQGLEMQIRSTIS